MSRSTPPIAAAESGPDVKQLEREELSTVPFPTPPSTSFRTWFDPGVYAGMAAHAAEDVSVEICGVLVGNWSRDADGPFVAVRNYIRCDSASKKFAEVTFTHESWAHINKEMDTKYQDLRIVGWYHSHPNFGIFLSDRDVFIQQNFFSGPGQIALVIDPVRKIEGVFEWRNGRPIPSPHYWVGPRILLAPAEFGATGMPEGPLDTPLMAEEVSSFAGANPTASIANLPWIALAGLAFFLMGWLLSGWRSDMERRALIEGTVAHFGLWRGLRPGLEDDLKDLEHDIEASISQLKVVSKDHLDRIAKAADDKDEGKAADRIRQDWKQLLEVSGVLLLRVRHMERLYSMTPEESYAVRRFIERKLIEISRSLPPDASESQIDGTETPMSPEPQAPVEPKKQPSRK